MREHLVSAAIRRDGTVHAGGFKAHYKIRLALGDADCSNSKHGDEEGFLTNTGRFLDRREANKVAFEAGQTTRILNGRPMLSSDIDRWEV